MSGIRTSVLVSKEDVRTVYHVRDAPPDKRQPIERQGARTHAWEHPDDEATRAACEACTSGKLPADVRGGAPGGSVEPRVRRSGRGSARG